MRHFRLFGDLATGRWLWAVAVGVTVVIPPPAPQPGQLWPEDPT